MRSLPGLFLACLLPSAAFAADVTVRDAASLQAALRDLKPGTTLKIAPGTYPGGLSTTGVDDLTIEALDPAGPPVFEGGNSGWQFSRCQGLTLRHLRFRGPKVNGLNLDDGGQRGSPVKGITLEHVDVSDIGPTGNHDAIKCSGLDGLTIRNCLITGWGGQGIDFVGCHKSLVTDCRFVGKPGFSASAAA